MSVIVFTAFLLLLDHYGGCSSTETAYLKLCQFIVNNYTCVEFAVRAIGIVLLFWMFETRERHIDQYWNLVLEYRRRDGTPVDEAELATSWRRDRARYSHRYRLAALLAFVIMGPSFHSITGPSAWVITFGVILLGTFLWMERMHKRWPCSAAQLPKQEAGHAAGFSLNHWRDVFGSRAAGADRLYGILVCVFWVTVFATLYGSVFGESIDG